MDIQIELTEFGKQLATVGWKPKGNAERKAGAKNEGNEEMEGKLLAAKEMIAKLNKENANLKMLAEERLEALGLAAERTFELEKEMKLMEGKLNEASHAKKTDAEKFAQMEKKVKEMAKMIEFKEERNKLLQEELDLTKAKIMDEHQQIMKVIQSGENVSKVTNFEQRYDTPHRSQQYTKRFDVHRGGHKRSWDGTPTGGGIGLKSGGNNNKQYGEMNQTGFSQENQFYGTQPGSTSRAGFGIKSSDSSHGMGNGSSPKPGSAARAGFGVKNLDTSTNKGHTG